MRLPAQLTRKELASIVASIHGLMYIDLTSDGREIFNADKPVVGAELVDHIGRLFERHDLIPSDEEPVPVAMPEAVLRYAAYSHETGELLSKSLFESISEAADATDYRDDAAYLPVMVPRRSQGDAEIDGSAKV